MKKRVIFIVLIFISMLVASGCSNQNKSEELKIGKYVMQDTEVEDWAWVLLKEDNQFEFNRDLATSYRPMGTYSIEDNILILDANVNGEYRFTIDGDKLIFNSSTIVGAIVKEGSVFKLSNKE